VCWNSINIQWDIGHALTDRISLAEAAFEGPCFIKIWACAAWNFGKSKNNLIFRAIPSSISRRKAGIQSYLFIHRYKVNATLVQPLNDSLLSIFSHLYIF
jgi:hypothetical protein